MNQMPSFEHTGLQMATINTAKSDIQAYETLYIHHALITGAGLQQCMPAIT